MNLTPAVKDECEEKLVGLLLVAHDTQAQVVEGLFQETAKLSPELTAAVVHWTGSSFYSLLLDALDKEDAEPLLLFYQSYARAGLAATKNAKDGLDYALLLAPQDDGLRLTAAYQQLLDKRVKEARQSLLPLAFSPHRGKQREMSRNAVAAIDAGDAEGARKALTN